jgi:hypothetical protein
MSKNINTFGEYCEALISDKEIEFLSNVTEKETWYLDVTDVDDRLTVIKDCWDTYELRIKPTIHVVKKGVVIFAHDGYIKISDRMYTEKEFNRIHPQGFLFKGFMYPVMEVDEEVAL